MKNSEPTIAPSPAKPKTEPKRKNPMKPEPGRESRPKAKVETKESKVLKNVKSKKVETEESKTVKNIKLPLKSKLKK